MSAEPNGLDFDPSNLLRSDRGVTWEGAVASAEVTAKATVPSLSLEERFDRLDQLCDRSRYLDAYELAQGFFGQELSAWPQMRGQRLAILLAKRLGGWQLARVLRYRFVKQFSGTPEARYYQVQHLTERQPLAKVWLQIRDEQLDTDRARLQAAWLAQKAHIISVFRDFDQADRLLDEAESLGSNSLYIPLARVSLLLESDRTQDALARCEALNTEHPGSSSIIAMLGNILTQLNRTDEAIQLLSDHLPQAQCGSVAVQLLGLLMQNKQYEEVETILRDAESYFPLATPERLGKPKPASIRSHLAAQRCELAYVMQDYRTCIQEARRSQSPYLIQLADHLEQFHGVSLRKELKVPFQRQAHMTCAPATLSMLAGYWNAEVDHDQIAREICFDGTSAVNQRLWAEENGFVAKEFRLTEESAHALIDLDIPFAITTAEPESSHIQVICGYDTKRGALLIQDPGTWYVGECNLAPMLETYAWCGPRAIVLVPEAKASILDMVELPETEQFDWLYQLELAARNHDRATAQQIYQQFEAWDANHRLTHWAKWSLAFQDHSLENSLDAMTSLCQLYPDSEALLLKRARLLASMGRLDGAISTLRKCIDDGEGGLASMTYLLTLLSDDCEEEIIRLLEDVMRQAPHSEFGLVHEAARLQRAKQYEHAYELLRLAAQLSPTDEQIIGRLSELAEQFGKQAEFLAFLKKRFDEFGHISEQPGLLFAKGLANYLQSDAAVEVLHQAIERRPDDGRLLCEAARLIGILRTPQDGLQLLEQATTALPELEKWLTVANLAERDGRLEDSLNAYRQVVTAGGDESSCSQTIAKLTAHVEGVDAAVKYACDLADRFPDHGNALTLAADWLGYVHQHQAALEYLDKSLQLDGTYGWAWRERAIACQALGRHEEALEAANKAIEFERNVYSFQIRAKILVSLKRIEEAKSDFRDAILENVNSAFAINGWIDLCQTDKERREALQCILQQLVTQAVDDEAVQAYYFQAKWLLPADVVEESLRIVQEKSPHLLCAWTLCAELLSSQRRNQEAIDCLVSQEERFAAVPEYWAQIGQLHADTDDQAAIRAFEQAYALDPNSVDAADELIRALHAQEMVAECKSVLSRTLAANPRNARMLLLASHLSDSQEEAVEFAKQAAFHSPRWQASWQRLEQVSDGSDQDHYLDVAKSLVAANPRDAASHVRFAGALDASQMEASMNALRQAIELEPHYVDAYQLLAFRLFQQGEVGEAIQICQTSEVTPTDARELQCYAAELLYEVDRKPEACTQLLAAIQDDVGQLGRWSQLADYAEEIDDKELYARAVDILVQNAPHNAATWGYCHGKHLHANEPDEAERCLRKAIELDPGYEYAVHRLGMHCISQSRWDDVQQVILDAQGHVADDLIWVLQLTMAVGQLDLEGFAQLLDSREWDDDSHSCVLRSARTWESHELTAMLEFSSPQMHDGSANALLGIAWAQASASQAGFANSLNDLNEFPSSAAWVCAASELVRILSRTDILAEDDALAIKAAMEICFRQRAAEMAFIPRTWADAIWTAAGLTDPKTAHVLASHFDPGYGPNSDELEAGLAAALMNIDLKLANQIVSYAVSAEQQHHPGFMCMAAHYYAYQGCFDTAGDILGQTDSSQLHASYLPMFELVRLALEAFQLGDTTSLDQHWANGFDQQDAWNYEHATYHKLRQYIAKRHGQPLRTAWHQWQLTKLAWQRRNW